MPADLATQSQSGRYLTFGLAGETYGIEILRVQEIVGLLPLTRVPKLPASIAGVVNLRGRIVPVIDLREAFELPAYERDDRVCIIIVRTESAEGSRASGLIVDEVSDVVEFKDDEVEPTPEFGGAIDASFISSVGRITDRVALLLDIDRVLSDSHAHDVAHIEDVIEAPVAEQGE